MALDGCLDVNEKKDDTIMVHHDDDQVKNVITHLLLWRGQVEFSPWVDIQELGSKINVCLEKWILYKKSKDSNLNHYEMLDEWRLQHVLKWSPSNQKSILLYSYGKWIFLIHVMETLVRSYTKQERVDRKEWDDMLSIVESLLFCIIPKCHELVTTAGSHLVMTQTLDSVSDVLLLLERCPVVSSPTPQSSSATEHSCLFRELHKHLLKWLAQCHPPSPGEQSMIVVHPLTYELVQTAVYLHVIRSFSCNHIEKYCFISHMMKLCSKLLFSDRTHKTLRSNISALTFRILSNGALPSLRTLCESFVILEGQNFVMNLQIQSFGKRKRNDDQIQRWKTLDGYVDLLPVFSKVLNNLFWTRLGDAKCETLMRDIEEVLLLEENEEVQCNRFRLLSKQAPTLLSLLSALLLNAPFVKQMKKEQTVRGILYSIAFMNDNCKDTIALFRQLSRIIDQKLVNHNKMVPWIQNVFQSISKKSTTSQKFGMCIVLPSLGVIVNNSAADGFIKVRFQSETVIIMIS
jgi:hypothetical protein